MPTSIQLASLPQRYLYCAPTCVGCRGELLVAVLQCRLRLRIPAHYQRQDAGDREIH